LTYGEFTDLRFLGIFFVAAWILSLSLPVRKKLGEA